MTIVDDGTSLRNHADEAALVGETRRRVRDEVTVDDRRSGLATGGSFITVMVAWLLLAPPPHVAAATILACICAYACAASVEFEIGPGSALPTTPVAVVTLFLLPPQLVPVVAVGGLALAAFVARLRDPSRRERAIVLAGSGWHAVGPAAVFAIAHISRPALHDWITYLVALEAQFLFDAASSWVRNCHGLGVPSRMLLRALAFTFLCDLLLAPVGLASALALPGSPRALLFLIPPTVLLAMLQHDRRRHIDHTVALSRAFTETEDLARRDALTGLLNRLAWEEATARYASSTEPLGVVLADVDGLKAANDGFGHDLGDRLLRAVSEVLAAATPERGGAFAARLGGDEFAILLPGDLAGRAHTVADGLRSAFATASLLEGLVPVSASIGVGVAASGPMLQRAIGVADRGVNVDKTNRGVRRR
ncbi:MAG: hypothetical protein QOH10_1301 [Actinomycetota bacterium]|nr:hypothetical protein [Actinomycetota bacterium]